MSASLSVIERKLLGKSASRCVRTGTVLLLLQIPMWVTVAAAGAAACAVPMRLSLLIDIGFALALMAASMRITEYLLASKPSRRCRIIGRTAAAGLAAAGVLNLVENAVLWSRFGDAAAQSACPSQVVAGLTPLWVGLGVVSAVVLTAAVIVARNQMKATGADPMRKAVIRDVDPVTRPGTVIACSGGGIRSASFCLGTLQALMTGGIYRDADAVVGVSGGGYMAAAFHLAGRSLEEDDDPPFAQGTPELALLRRNTRYLLPHGVEVFRGVMSVLYGVVVNILIIGATLWGIAWVLGWYLHEYAVLDDRGGRLFFEPPTGWWAIAVASWAAAVAGFVVMEKILDRFVQVADGWRRGSRSFTRSALLLGTATMTLMVAVPAALAWLSGQRDGTPLLAAFHDLVTPDRGSTPALFALATTVVGSLIGLGRTVVKGLGTAGEGDSLISRLVTMLRVRVAPWLGSILIVVAAFVVLLRLTNNYATSAAWRADWGIAVILVAVVLGVRVLTDANRTSLHHFYRERLSMTYLVKRVDKTTATSRRYKTPLTVSGYGIPDLKRPNGPKLVMAAVANAVDEEYVPTGRGCVPFIIDAELTGVIGDRSLPKGGRTRTERYEAFADYDRRDLTIPAAMAMSGAAVSPLTGRASSRTRPVRVLLTVLNARLGVWLPNPYGQPPAFIDRARHERAAYDACCDENTWQAKARLTAWEVAARVISVGGKPGPYRLLREAFGRPSLYDRKLYVTDGGHYDNLGLLEALRRRPERVFVIDASNDAANSFGALAEAIATARMDLGVEIKVDVSPLQANKAKDKRARQAWTVGQATYDDSDDVTEIVFLKAQLIPDLTWDVEHYARENPDFPRRSTGDQFYDEWDFEAYRELGHTLAERMLAQINAPAAVGRTTLVPEARAVPESEEVRQHEEEGDRDHDQQRREANPRR